MANIHLTLWAVLHATTDDLYEAGGIYAELRAEQGYNVAHGDNGEDSRLAGEAALVNGELRRRGMALDAVERFRDGCLPYRNRSPKPFSMDDIPF